MGPIVSRVEENYDPVNFEILQIAPADLRVLYSFYKKVCSSKLRNMISPNEIFTYLKQRPTTFMSRIFSLVSDSENLMDFHAFVFYIWNFCTLKSDDLGNNFRFAAFFVSLLESFLESFTFTLYDEDNRCVICTNQIN